MDSGQPLRAPSDFDRLIQRALLECVGLFFIALSACVAYFSFQPFSFDALANWLKIVAITELLFLGVSFIFREPAIESVLKLLARSFRKTLDARPAPTVKTADAPTEKELEQRIDKALRYILDGNPFTRRHLCDEKGLFSQTEWKAWRDRCVKTGILSPDGASVSALSYQDARKAWDKDLPAILIRVNNNQLVRASGLFKEQAHV